MTTIYFQSHQSSQSQEILCHVAMIELVLIYYLAGIFGEVALGMKKRKSPTDQNLGKNGIYSVAHDLLILLKQFQKN